MPEITNSPVQERETKLELHGNNGQEEHDEITSVQVKIVPFTLPIVKQVSELIPFKHNSTTHSDDKIDWKTAHRIGTVPEEKSTT